MALRETIRRGLAELRLTPSSSEAERALAGLALRDVANATDDARPILELLSGAVDASTRIVEVRRRDEPPELAPIEESVLALGDLGRASPNVVVVARGVYERIPTARARAALLDAARRAASTAVVLHVDVNDVGTHFGRVLLDLPRGFLRRLGLPLPEPGDRFGPARYRHAFFDDEALIAEIERAGLVIRRRRGRMLALEDASRTGMSTATGPERARSFSIELVRAASVVRAIDDARQRASPRDVLAMMRARGRANPARGPIGRARLRRAIGWIDALAPSGPSCYRRVLLEVALDAGAACEALVFGLDVGKTGHVAFEGREDASFDVSFTIPADEALRARP